MAQTVKKKNPPTMQETQVRFLGQEDPLKKKWQPTPVFLPGKSHGQRSLVVYSPLGRKESDMTEPLRLHIVSPYHSDVLDGVNSVYYSPSIVLCVAQC